MAQQVSQETNESQQNVAYTDAEDGPIPLSKLIVSFSLWKNLYLVKLLLDTILGSF